MPNEKFRYPVLVGFGDANVEGTIYWSRYFEWFGKAREVFLFYFCPDFLALYKSGLRIDTHETNIKHLSPGFFGDKIILEMHVGEIKKVSVNLAVDFIREADQKKIAEGWQVTVFTNCEGNLTPIPPEIREPLLKYLAE
ncbi:MAG: hypothetical protein A3D46_00490 [Candidatus Nealsonbacteria bacterium RIFCSPHIGHO2_02_FULL_43_13]|uniref:Thioesterase domain-containing protein n=1 Tax=Candidatus Nealsonbacteria bacterium RIFCSPHIGHO2_02_FULL_43_13 TaxID=1801668 RepID=A0A1G2E8Y6_9BACT|nr:MAG: hypothetical protein A3D46_00490 [Candidatus Nealsonbacteria bacterium RIFCSPHIGHO2_02_FULL_43_13]